MDSTRYVQIPCRVCGGKNLAIGGEPRPTQCVHCKAQLEGRPPVGARSSGARPTPATFTRGTFRHTPESTPKPRPASLTNALSRPLKAPHEPSGGFKDRLLRLFEKR